MSGEEAWECGPHANAWNGHDARCRRVATPAEPARESDGVGLRLSDVENGWVTVLWDRNGRRGRLAEAKRDLERIIAARVAEAGAEVRCRCCRGRCSCGGKDVGVPTS